MQAKDIEGLKRGHEKKKTLNQRNDDLA